MVESAKKSHGLSSMALWEGKIVFRVSGHCSTVEWQAMHTGDASHYEPLQREYVSSSTGPLRVRDRPRSQYIKQSFLVVRLLP
jgi:hypothetical protein